MRENALLELGVTAPGFVAAREASSLAWVGLRASASNLVAANFDDAVLTGASFRGATLNNASFSGAQLFGATFEDATLHGADLSRAHVRGADFRGARLLGASMPPGSWWRECALSAETICPDGANATWSGVHFTCHRSTASDPLAPLLADLRHAMNVFQASDAASAQALAAAITGLEPEFFRARDALDEMSRSPLVVVVADWTDIDGLMRLRLEEAETLLTDASALLRSADSTPATEPDGEEGEATPGAAEPIPQPATPLRVSVPQAVPIDADEQPRLESTDPTPQAASDREADASSGAERIPPEDDEAEALPETPDPDPPTPTDLATEGTP